jgi:hypothetical protein
VIKPSLHASPDIHTVPTKTQEWAHLDLTQVILHTIVKATANEWKFSCNNNNNNNNIVYIDKIKTIIYGVQDNNFKACCLLRNRIRKSVREDGIFSRNSSLILSYSLYFRRFGGTSRLHPRELDQVIYCAKLFWVLCKALLPISKYVASSRTCFTQLNNKDLAFQVRCVEETAHLKYYSNPKCHWTHLYPPTFPFLYVAQIPLQDTNQNIR